MTAKKSAAKKSATAKKPGARASKSDSAVSDVIAGPPKANPQGMSNPAARALLGIRVTKVSQLAGHREADVAELHGMGPKALVALRTALKAQGKSFKP